MTQRDKIVTNLEIFLGGLVLGWISWKIRGFLWKVFLEAPAGIELYRGEDFITYGWSPLVFFAGLGALAFLLISVFLLGFAILALFEFIGQCQDYFKLVSTMKNDTDWKKRLVAAEALARNKSRRGIDYLNVSLESDNAEIRKSTEEIIAQFKDKTPYNVTQIPISYRTCLKCLHSNPSDATKCENCGIKLEALNKDQITEKKNSTTERTPDKQDKLKQT